MGLGEAIDSGAVLRPIELHTAIELKQLVSAAASALGDQDSRKNCVAHRARQHATGILTDCPPARRAPGAG